MDLPGGRLYASHEKDSRLFFLWNTSAEESIYYDGKVQSWHVVPAVPCGQLVAVGNANAYGANAVRTVNAVACSGRCTKVCTACMGIT